MFHGYLELALLAFFFVRRNAPVPAEADHDHPEQRHPKNPTDRARPGHGQHQGRGVRATETQN
jgi:hypothetical protein